MGGYGSGRSGWKRTCEGMDSIDINWMKRQGYIKDGCHRFGSLSWSCGGRPCGSIGYEVRLDLEPGYIRLHYTHNKTERLEYRVSLTSTPCNYGGFRWWFICSHCGRRVGKLYGGKYFLCRICQDLTYRSCNQSDFDRQLSKAEDIRDRLGAPSGSINRILFKPKGMHQKTFDRLRFKAEELENQAWLGMGRKKGWI